MGRIKKYNTEEERIEANRLASRKWYEDNKHLKATQKCSFKYEKCDNTRNHIAGSYCQYHAQIMAKSNKYKISPIEILNLYKIDNCSICNSSLKNKSCIDHNHTTGKVRDVICHNCNVIIGMAKEKTFILEKIIKYIKQHER